MNKNYSFFTFSIFYDCSFKEIVTAINQIKKTQITSNKIIIREGEANIDQYFNPQSGGAHLPQFCCWESEKYPNKIFLISNYEDGLYTFCNIIHKHVGKNFIMCSLSNEAKMDNPFYQFYFSNMNFEERKIMAYEEDKWIFYEEGSPLDIEDENNYKNRVIKKRLNSDIIVEYLNKIGIDLWEIDKSIIYSTTYVQKEW